MISNMTIGLNILGIQYPYILEIYLNGIYILKLMLQVDKIKLNDTEDLL